MRRQTMTMKTTTKNNHIVFFSSLARIRSRTMASLFFPSSFAMSMARLLLLPIVAAVGSRGCGWFRVDTIFFGSTFRTVIASLFPLNFFRLLSFTMAFPHRCDVSFLLLDVSRVAPFLPFFLSLCVLNYVWDTYVRLKIRKFITPFRKQFKLRQTRMERKYKPRKAKHIVLVAQQISKFMTRNIKAK